MRWTCLVSVLICGFSARAQLTPEEGFAERYGTPETKAKMAAKRAAVTAAAPTTAADYRVVTNHVFVVPKSVYWKPFSAECIAFLTNGIVVQQVTTNRTYTRVGGPLTANQSLGAYAPEPASIVHEELVPGRKFFLQNCPQNLQPASGKIISFMAMQTGRIQFDTEMLEVWDCGIPYADWAATHPAKK